MPGYTIQKSVASLKVMLPVEAAYLAGIVDGEGSIGLSISTNNKRTQLNPRMSAANTKLQLLEWIVSTCGNGGIYEKRNLKEGNNSRNSYNWILSANQIRWVLPQVMPYLVIKKKHAELLLEYLSLIRGHLGISKEDKPRAEAIHLELRELNSRGIEDPNGYLRETECSVEECRNQGYKGSGFCYFHWMAQREFPKGVCANCGIQIELNGFRKRFCSQKCQCAYWYKTKGKPEAEKEKAERPKVQCLFCNADIDISHYKRKKYCNDTCAGKHKWQKKLEVRAVLDTPNKLTPDAVKLIRALYATGEFTVYTLAEVYEVHPTTISKVVNLTNWQSVE